VPNDFSTGPQDDVTRKGECLGGFLVREKNPRPGRGASTMVNLSGTRNHPNDGSVSEKRSAHKPKTRGQQACTPRQKAAATRRKSRARGVPKKLWQPHRNHLQWRKANLDTNNAQVSITSCTNVTAGGGFVALGPR